MGLWLFHHIGSIFVDSPGAYVKPSPQHHSPQIPGKIRPSPFIHTVSHFLATTMTFSSSSRLSSLLASLFPIRSDLFVVSSYRPSFPATPVAFASSSFFFNSINSICILSLSCIGLSEYPGWIGGEFLAKEIRDWKSWTLGYGWAKRPSRRMSIDGMRTCSWNGVRAGQYECWLFHGRVKSKRA